MAQPKITLNPENQPWDQQKGESNKQYARFTYYRDLGRVRDLRRTQALLTDIGDKIKMSSLYQLSYQMRWSERASAWDLAQDIAEGEQLIVERRDMIRRHRSVAGALLAKAVQALKETKPAEMYPADIARFVKLATDLERLAIGDPQRTISITGPAGGPIQTEDVTQLSPEERRTRLAEIAAELAARAGTSLNDDEEEKEEEEDE